MLDFSLMTDRWIPVIEQKGEAETLWSLNMLLDNLDSIWWFSGNPYLQISLWRFVVAAYLGGVTQELSPWTLHENPLLSKFESTSEGIRADDFLRFADGNAVAWTPYVRRDIPPETIAQALVQAYFSDRAGLKASIKEVRSVLTRTETVISPTGKTLEELDPEPKNKTSISGASPPHVGKTSVFKAGETLGGMLELNIKPEWGEEMIEFLLHKWRRIKIVGDRLVIGANVHYLGSLTDQWVIDSGRMKHIRNPEEIEVEDGEYMGITLCLKQAKPLASDRFDFVKSSKEVIENA